MSGVEATPLSQFALSQCLGINDVPSAIPYVPEVCFVPPDQIAISVSEALQRAPSNSAESMRCSVCSLQSVSPPFGCCFTALILTEVLVVAVSGGVFDRFDMLVAPNLV